MPVTIPSSAKYVVFDVESVGLLGQPWAIGWVAVNSTGFEVASGATWSYPEWVVDPVPREALDFAGPAVESLSRIVDATDPTTVLRDLWEVWVQAKQAGANLYCDVHYPVDANALRLAHIDAVQRGVATALESGPMPLLDIACILAFHNVPRTIVVSEDHHNPIADARASWKRLAYMLWECKPTLPKRV